MSISTGAGEPRRPSVVSTGKQRAAGGEPPADGKSGETTEAKSGAAKSGAAKSGAEAKPGGAKPAGAAKPGGKSGGTRPGAGRPAGKGTKRPVPPVKVHEARNWFLISMWGVAVAVVLGILGAGTYFVIEGSKSWQDKAAGIDGIVNYNKTNPKMLTRNHKQGVLQYSVSPPVGGDHNPVWQNCQGDVYDAPIANEHAAHSLEHGAVWITYDPSLPADQVEKLAKKVRGHDYSLMSPYPNLGAKVSLQAWGYQLKVNSVDDGRIDKFIDALRQNDTQEDGATCANGVTATGTTPHTISNAGTQQQGQG